MEKKLISKDDKHEEVVQIDEEDDEKKYLRENFDFAENLEEI